MKTLYLLIGGTMGVVRPLPAARAAAALLHSVFFNGDWCWNIHPFR